MAPSVSRIDRLLKELESSHGEAQQIFDAHATYMRTKLYPKGGLEDVKLKHLTGPAGSALNYVEALKIVRKSIVGE